MANVVLCVARARSLRVQLLLPWAACSRRGKAAWDLSEDEPKRRKPAKTAFAFFREQFHLERTGKKKSESYELTKQCQRAWEELDKSDKEKFEEMEIADKERVKKARADAEQLELSVMRTGGIGIKKAKTKPKKPKSKYMHFHRENVDRIRRENPGLPFIEIPYLVSLAYKALSPEELAVYEKKGEESAKQYRLEMAEYEKDDDEYERDDDF